MKKKLLIIGLGVAMSVISLCASASTLTLVNQNIPNPINVSCNAINGLPIPVGGKLGPLPYIAIYLMFGKKFTENCTFTENGTQIGIAALQLGPKLQHAQIISDTISPDYSVAISPANATSQPVSDITVTLIQN